MLKNTKRMFALVLTVVMLISLLPTVSAASLSDIKGHWAEDYIEYGVSTGYISGYTNGTFRPNNTVTRAEFSKMVNTALGINHSATIGFTDVSSNDWFYQEVKKAVSAGYISGYSDNTFGANRNITRQEAAVMLARIVTEPESTGSTTFQDASTIDSWALASISKMVAKTYMQGDQKGNFRPKAALTRAEAAKILYEVLKNEIIASSNQSFSVAGSSYYNTIYPNNVTITEGVINGAINFNSCRILGTLTASGGMDSSVNLSNTGVNTLVAASTSGEAKVTLSGSSYVTKTTVNNGVTLSGNDFDTVFLSGSSLSSDTVRLNGNFETVNVDTDAVIKATGTINQFTVYDRATLMLQSGSITRMDVEEAAKNSMISLAGGVTVGTAYIKTAASFTGTGSITTAYEGSGTVSYETRPLSVVGGSGNYDDEDDNTPFYDDEDDDTTSSLVPRFYPTTRSTDVSLEPTIRLYFDAPIYRSSSKTSMTTSYIENYAVELREGSLSGYSIPFTASLNTSDTTVTISPDEELEPDTTYYIVVVAGKLYNASGESNGRSYAYFTTEDDYSGNYGNNDSYTGTGNLKPTFSPANGQTSVARYQTVRISFPDTVYRSSGSTLSESYLENNCIEVYKDNLEGNPVSFKATLNSSKSIITLTPGANWETNTTYYIVIPAGTLSDRNNNLNSRIVSRFSTGATIDGGDILFHPANGATDVALDGELTITFESPIYQYGGGTVTARYLEESVLELRRSSNYGYDVSFTAEISSNKRSITILPDEPLDQNTTYFLIINNNTLQYSSNNRIASVTSQFKTSDGTLRLSDLSLGDVTSSTADIYVTSNSSGTVTVTLSSSKGAPISQTVSVTAGRQTSMTFTGLESNTAYTVTAVAKDAAGRTSQEKTKSFLSGSLSFEIAAKEITRSSATVEASYNAIGSISISYKKEGDSENKVILSNFTPNRIGSKTVALTNLDSGATYHVSATFEDASGNTVNRSTVFKTDSVSTDSALTSLRINGGDGSYEVELKPDVYTYDVSIANTTSITVTPVAAAGERATIKVNNYIVKSGQLSNEIYVRANSTVAYTTQIRITVQPESGPIKTYTINVKVAPAL